MPVELANGPRNQARPSTVAIRLITAAVAAGAVLGLGARLLMRLIALEAGLRGHFSLGASLEVVLFGVLLGAPVAVGFWLVRPRLRLPSPYAGLCLGLVITVLLAVFPPPSARTALDGTPDTPLLTLLGYGVLFTAWGSCLERLTRWIWRATP